MGGGNFNTENSINQTINNKNSDQKTINPTNLQETPYLKHR